MGHAGLIPRDTRGGPGRITWHVSLWVGLGRDSAISGRNRGHGPEGWVGFRNRDGREQETSFSAHAPFIFVFYLFFFLLALHSSLGILKRY